MTETTESPSMIDVDLGDAKPLKTLPDNQEVKLTIVKASLDESKSREGVYNLHLWLDCGQDDVDDIQQWIPVPNESWKSSDFKEWQKAVNRFKDFATACGFTPPLETDRLIGLEGWAIIGQEEYNRNAGQYRNNVRGWVTKA